MKQLARFVQFVCGSRGKHRLSWGDRMDGLGIIGEEAEK